MNWRKASTTKRTQGQWWDKCIKMVVLPSEKSTTSDMAKRYAMIDEEMKGLDPANFEDGHKYFMELEDLNDQLTLVNKACMLTKMQLKVKAFNSIHKGEDNELIASSQFRNEMSKDDKLSKVTYQEFKDEYTEYWTNNGNPANMSNQAISKALVVMETRTCYICGQKGHIARNCPKK